ncbi:protein of unknown function [Azospirillum baldaniorum]|uniref:Uncharacterized protein n=1 Tax=Azospirillum baldaniorum TaxID=1064539 RepID=A0A9P1JN38_9PROT|nr:protein of unknown function [Azospirillum baldaniorum]
MFAKVCSSQTAGPDLPGPAVLMF